MIGGSGPSAHLSLVREEFVTACLADNSLMQMLTPQTGCVFSMFMGKYSSYKKKIINSIKVKIHIVYTKTHDF